MYLRNIVLHQPTILTHHLIDYYMCSSTQPKTRKDTTDSTLFVQQPSCLVSQETWLRPPPHWPISDTAPPVARRILPGSNCGAVLPNSPMALRWDHDDHELRCSRSCLSLTGTGDIEFALQWTHITLSVMTRVQICCMQES